MRKQLIYKDDKSDKFWNIEVSENSFTVTYGKSGTSGTTQTKTFDNEEQCIKEAEKLISEKLKKGYQNADQPSQAIKPNDYLKEWNEIINAKDFQSALIKHFSYLADTPGYEKVLELVFKKAEKVEISEDNEILIIRFVKNENIFTASKPGKIQNYKEFPKSFQKVISIHEFLEYGDEDESFAKYLVLGDHGSFVNELEDEEDIFENALSPLIVEQSDWFIYHPEEKNKYKEPVLYYVSHEDASMGESSSINIGSLFLKNLGESLEIDFSVSDEKESNNEKKSIKQIQEIPLPFDILCAESFDKFRIGAIFKKDDQYVFGILDTENPENIKVLGSINFQGQREDFRLKIYGSYAIIYNNSSSSFFNPFVSIDISDRTSPKISVINEKGTNAAAFNNDYLIFNSVSLIKQNLKTGDQEKINILPRIIEIQMDERFIVVQNQEELKIIDHNNEMISSGKVESSFPTTILFSDLKCYVILDDIIQMINFTSKKIVKQKIPLFAKHSVRQPNFVKNKTIWFLTTYKNKYNLARINVESTESSGQLWPLNEDMDYNEKVIEVIGDEIRIYLYNKVFIYNIY